MKIFVMADCSHMMLVSQEGTKGMHSLSSHCCFSFVFVKNSTKKIKITKTGLKWIKVMTYK